VPGLIAAGLLVCLVLTALAGLWQAGSTGSQVSVIGPYLWRITLGAAFQAAVSMLLSLGLGSLLALALARRLSLRWRSPVLTMLAVVTAAPALVIVYGIIALWGRAGTAGMVVGGLGFGFPNIYGLSGIVLAHVTMNMPFVARALLDALERQPGERFRLAQALGFSPMACFRHLDLPILRRELPGLGALVFLLCFTSFAVVLMLGGGPANSTLEVAIYEAIRVEADFARAALLAGLQLVSGLLLVTVIGRFTHRAVEAGSRGDHVPRPDLASTSLKAFDWLVLVVAISVLAPPVLSALIGLAALGSAAEGEVAQAALTSLVIAALAACVATGLALAMAMTARAHEWAGTMNIASLALLGLPPMALVTGLYIWLRGMTDPASLGVVLVPLVNGLMALPFAYRLIAPPLALAQERHGRLASSLGLSGRARWRVLDGPALRGILPAALALSAAFSLGDFGVIALFGGGDLKTLPSLLGQRLGSYRTDEAAALALLLLALTAALALVAERWGSRNAGD
jgi:thiamine transport system permease protein